MVHREKQHELDLNMVFQSSETHRGFRIGQNPRNGNPKRDFSVLAPGDHNQGLLEVHTDLEVPALSGGIGARIEEEQPEGWDVRLSFPSEPPFSRVSAGLELHGHSLLCFRHSVSRANGEIVLVTTWTLYVFPSTHGPAYSPNSASQSSYSYFIGPYITVQLGTLLLFPSIL